MAEDGFEIGSHSLNHWQLEQYNHPHVRLWNPAAKTNNVNDLVGVWGSMQPQTLWGETDGDTMNVWADSMHATNGYSWIAPVVARNPTFHANRRAGLPGVEFEGITLNKQLKGIREGGGQSGDSLVAGSMSFYFVIDPDTLGEGGTHHYLMDAYHGAAPNEQFIMVPRHNADGLIRAWAPDGWTSFAEAPHAGPQMLIFIFDEDDDEILCYRNGTKLTLGALDNGYTAQKLWADAIWLGTDHNNNNEYDGDVYEFGIFEGDLDDFARGSSGDTWREVVEGYLAHKWDLADSLPFVHEYKFSPPTHQVYGIQQLNFEVFGNKTMLEELINYNGGTWRKNDYRCLSYAYTGGGNFMYDEYIIATVQQAHIGARILGTGTDSLLAGRGLGHLLPNWHRLDPYTVPVIKPMYGSNGIVDDGDTSADHDTTKSNFELAMKTLLEHANPAQHSNVWGVVFWHDDLSPENVTDGHMRAIIEQLETHADSIWIAPFGEVLAYWREAHARKSELEYRSFK
jgi:hypothetical protein